MGQMYAVVTCSTQMVGLLLDSADQPADRGRKRDRAAAEGSQKPAAPQPTWGKEEDCKQLPPIPGPGNPIPVRRRRTATTPTH